MKKRRGFTLLELLMVVIIIGILASIALPQYLRTAERSRASEALQLMSAMRSSEARFRAQNPGGLYTQDLALLDIDLPGVTVSPTLVMTTASWSIAVTGGVLPAGNPEITATRVGVPPYGGLQIFMDLNGGATCTVAAGTTIYGLPGPGC